LKPGITGWAQVSQGHVANLDEVREKLRYDFYYVKNFSIWLDMLIVLKTIVTVFTGFGAR
jgi:lipopolysaccharide/colanic/teichoic acid biosynthesis glycosyltransferase